MKEVNSNVLSFPQQTSDVLTDILRRGAQDLLSQAVKAEVAVYIDAHSGLQDNRGYRLVVRNGHLPEREIQTPLGQITIKQPRVNDKRLGAEGQRFKFTSAILPAYLRRTKSLEELIPWLYLKGISSGDFGDALSALLGKDAPGLSAATVGRLKEGWQTDHEVWSKRRFDNKRYIYIWADGIYFNIRLGEDDRM